MPKCWVRPGVVRPSPLFKSLRVNELKIRSSYIVSRLPGSIIVTQLSPPWRPTGIDVAEAVVTGRVTECGLVSLTQRAIGGS
jgi:hypothetical protein